MNAKPMPIGGNEETAARLRNLFEQYAERKLDWLEKHPDAEAEEVEDAMRRIALELGL